MEHRTRWYHNHDTLAHAMIAASMMVIAIFFAVAVIWLVASRPNAKLYEADGVVCISQPFSSQCFKR